MRPRNTPFAKTASASRMSEEPTRRSRLEVANYVSYSKRELITNDFSLDLATKVLAHLGMWFNVASGIS